MRKDKVFNVGIAGMVTVGLVLLGIFVFPQSYVRLGKSLVDLGNSIAYYFCKIFGIESSVIPTVTEYSKVFEWNNFLPIELDSFKENLIEYGNLLVDKENFVSWWQSVSLVMGDIAKVFGILLPFILLLIIAIKMLYAKSNTKHSKDTVPLKVFKGITKYTYQPLKSRYQSFKEYLEEHNAIWILWIVMVVLHLNLASIIVSFFAYYFYFAVEFDIANVYVQFCKLAIDLQVVFRYFPWWILLFVVYWLFRRMCRKIAINRLRHYEARNCGFINDLPIVSMTCGSMGKKKTTIITDMTLSQEVMFRQKALSILQETDMKFPYFPWIGLEMELRKCMEYGEVYNLATVKRWIEKKSQRFRKHHRADLQLYGYDYKRYGTVYDDALKVDKLFSVLEVYALAYFIYVIQSSLIVANYSIRTDNVMIDGGNFPIWNLDFFRGVKRRQRSRHSHILDFDVLRLGQKVLKNNPRAGSFEFGVVAITEIGKERGNNLELREVKKGNDVTNQKNDLFNSWLKMCRHSATVANYPFIKVFTDEQRLESWGADARDLCEILNIISTSEQRLTLPFYTIEDMLSEWTFNWFINLYYDFRFRRGDNTLFVYLLKGVTAWIWTRRVRVYNLYGYRVARIEKERGTQDGKVEKKKCYILNQKIYSKRFSTDCFSDYFNDLAAKCNVGIEDYLEYATERASVEELKMQNSYFINSLYKDAKDNGRAA